MLNIAVNLFVERIQITSMEPIVQGWEAYKTEKNTNSGARERIPESVLRMILSNQDKVSPEDVTWEQLNQAGGVLCRHYGSLLIIPLHLETSDLSTVLSEPIGTAQFWREREDEFRKHNIGANTLLGATWAAEYDHWSFHAGQGAYSEETVHLFKSLAREASKGLGRTVGPESWRDWVDRLRLTTDDDAEPLYAKISTGSSVLGENWLERMARLGESVPSGALIEFLLTDDASIRRRLYWDTSSATIENVYEKSANLCIAFRSLARALSSDSTSLGLDWISISPEIRSEEPLRAKNWEDIELSFVNDHEVVFRVGDEVQKFHYKDIEGFEDRRTGKPSQLWAMVRVFGSSLTVQCPTMRGTARSGLPLRRKSREQARHFES